MDLANYLYHEMLARFLFFPLRVSQVLIDVANFEEHIPAALFWELRKS